MAIEAKPLPLDELHESGGTAHSLWKGMGDNGTEFSLVGLYNAGVEQLQVLADIRKQQGSAKDKLQTSDNPEAITYREWAAKAASRREAIDAEYNPEIKALQEQVAAIRQKANERKKVIDTKLHEQMMTAIQAITDSTKVDLDVSGAIARYKEISDQLNAAVKMFNDFPAGDVFAPLKGFRLPGPGVATGATKVASGSGATGTKRFRWGQVTVDDTTLDQPTTKEIAKACGSNSEEHFKTSLLTSLNGVWENLPREPQSPHTFEWAGHRITLALRAATKKAETESEASDQVAA